MFKGGKEFEGTPRVLVTLASSAVPLAVVGGLLYAAFFVKAQAVVSNVRPPAIERRDNFLGVTNPTEKTIWAVGANGKIVRSEDGGASWAAQLSPIQTNLQSIAAWSAERAVAVGNGGVVLRTDDGGTTWKEVEAPKSEVANKLLRVRAYDKGIAWAVGELGAVLKSTDYGKTWVRALPEKDQAWNDIAFVGKSGWLVGEFGQVMRSVDGGESWSAADSGIKSSLMSVSFRNANDGVAVGLSGAVLHTSDGGAKWVPADRQTKEHLNHVIWDSAEWRAVGDKGVMVLGSADAATWKAARISEGDLSWHTHIEAMRAAGTPNRFLLAGSSLALLDGKTLKTFGRASD